MEPIELEHWEPDPSDPRYLRYVSQPNAEEVFQELKQRLEQMGMLPDEYFVMNMEWENGREIPKGADIFTTTDYGESEGVYVDLYLKWYEDGKPVIKSFVTGKTLGETGFDMDRMFLTASAITKSFHGEGAHDVRQGAVLLLNAEEKELLSEVLSVQEPAPELRSILQKLDREPQQIPEQVQNDPGMEMSL